MAVSYTHLDVYKRQILGCANQAGEDNRNVARMALLLAGLPYSVPGLTVNRLCGSGMEAIGAAARAIRSGEAQLIIAGGVESMTRAPFVMAKSSEPFARQAEIYDTTIGWRFVNKKLEKLYGVDSMIETAENLAEEYNISREDQDLFAYQSQLKTKLARDQGWFDPVSYTHLDVYKRQCEGRCGFCRSGRRDVHRRTPSLTLGMARAGVLRRCRRLRKSA